MPTALIYSPIAPPESAADLWRSIEGAVREACLLRAEGREPEALAMLQDTVQPLIGRWSRSSGQDTPACQQALRVLFARVQEQVATANVCKRLVLRSLEAPAAGRNPEPRPVQVQVRRRVPIGDIPGMLDALDESERMAAWPRRTQNALSGIHNPITRNVQTTL